MRRAVLPLALATITALVAGGLHAAEAHAYDVDPCSPKQERVEWTKDAVQLCPVTGLINGGVPLYAHPIRHDRGAPGPKVQSWLAPSNARLNGKAVKALRFRCQRQFQRARYFHPNGKWFNTWWALTHDADGKIAWVPQVYFQGAGNNEPDLKLRNCGDAPSPPPAPPSPPPCDPTRVDPAVKLSAQFRNSQKVATVRFGKRPTVIGALTNASGAPMPGATICVGVQDRADGPVTEVERIATDESGRYAYKLPVGASRRFWFVHRTGAGAAADNVDVRVRAPVKMRSSRRSLRNGEATRFKGRVGGDDTRGLLVELQYPQRGGWQTFATDRVGRKGRFRYRYRFTRTVGTRIYRLRAKVPAQRGYPFVAGASRTVRVRVSG